MKKLVAVTLLLVLLVSASAVVVRPAPDFTFPGVGNKARSLRSLRGQAVVLVIADSQRDRAFRKQLRYLREIYQQFASRQVIFVAALQADDGPVRSDIPFVRVNNAPAVAAAYGVGREFSLAIIGKDGNIDYQTEKVATGQRVRDVIQNSFAVQAQARKR